MSGTEWNRTQGFGVTAGALEAGAKWKKTRGFGICISTPEEAPADEVEVYEGPYVAVPSASEEQVLNTEGLLMAENVVVRRVPYQGQAKSVTPSKTAQTVSPDAGYDHLTQVVVEAIPYTVTPNAAGGLTVNIG